MPLVRRQRRRKSSTGPNIIVCGRVGHIGNAPIPSGTVTEACLECESPIWVTPASQDLARSSGGETIYLCCICMRFGPPRKD